MNATLLDQLITQAKLTTTNTKYANKSARDSFYQSQTWRNKRKDILRRDNNECQVTKSKGGVCRTKLIVHHIKPLEFFPELALDDYNLITVTQSIHNVIHGLNERQFDDEWW